MASKTPQVFTLDKKAVFALHRALHAKHSPSSVTIELNGKNTPLPITTSSIGRFVILAPLDYIAITQNTNTHTRFAVLAKQGHALTWFHPLSNDSPIEKYGLIMDNKVERHCYRFNFGADEEESDNEAETVVEDEESTPAQQQEASDEEDDEADNEDSSSDKENNPSHVIQSVVLNKDNLFTIHFALHNDACDSVIVQTKDGSKQQLDIVENKAGCRLVNINGVSIMVQNLNKNSAYAKLAKKGHKLSWVIPSGSRFQKWGLIHNDTIEQVNKHMSALVGDQNTSESQKSQKIHSAKPALQPAVTTPIRGLSLIHI